MYITSIKYLIALISFALVSVLSYAANTWGGEMYASHIGNNKYMITYKAYQNCGSGSKLPDTTNIKCYAGTSYSCGTVSIKASKISVRDLTYKCSTGTSCKFGSPISEVIYQCTADLNSKVYTSLLSGSCQEITFFATGWFMPFGSCYSAGGTESVVATTLYIGNLNRCKSKTNIAPALFFDPIRNIRINQKITIAQGLVDTSEYDWLHFQLSPSMYQVPFNNKTCSATPNSNYLNPFTPYCNPAAIQCTPNKNTSPIQGTLFDTMSGDLSFYPTVADEKSIISYRIMEYRRDSTGKWTLIAKHTREIGAITFDANGTNEAPSILWGSGISKTCVGTSVKSKIFDITDFPVPGQSKVDSLLVIVPKNIKGGILKVYSSSINQSAIELNWNPSLTDTAYIPYLFPIKIIDQHCDPPLEMSITHLFTIYPKPDGEPLVSYLGCNKLALQVKNLRGGPDVKCTWQVNDANGKLVATSKSVKDTLFLNGPGKYNVQALFSNRGLCFKSWDTSFNIIDTLTSFHLGGKTLITDTINCPNATYLAEPFDLVGKNATLSYQWYALDQTLAYGYKDPRKIPTNALKKIATSKNLSILPRSDTAFLLSITDNQGCIESRELRIIQIFSKALSWKKKPLEPICASNPPFKLIDPLNKDMSTGDFFTNIRCLNGKYLDSIGPNYYKVKAPAKPNTGEKISLFLVASFDTLGCISRDTNTIDVVYSPLFNLNKEIKICTSDSGFCLSTAVTKPATKAKPFEWSIISKPSKSPAQLLSTTINHCKGIHLITHFDSIALGKYVISACAIDSALGCRSCDTTTIISKSKWTFVYVGDSVLCPNDPPVQLHKFNKVTSGESSDSIYSMTFYDINGESKPNFNPSQLVDTKNGILFPRIATGKLRIAFSPQKYCYADGLVLLRIQDTLAIKSTVTPDSIIRLPKTSFTFTANTISSRVWWDFGSGLNADTSTLNPITWSFENKPASYRVKVRSFNTNTCYGESQIKVFVLPVTALQLFDLNAKIANNLLLVSSYWTLEKLEVFDLKGKRVYFNTTNQGVPINVIPYGVYIYRLHAQNAKNQVIKTGTWVNVLD